MGAGPDPRPASDALSLGSVHCPPLQLHQLTLASALKPRPTPLPKPLPANTPATLRSRPLPPQHHRARGAAEGQHELPGLHEQGAAEPGPPRAPHDQQPQDPVRAGGLRGRSRHPQGACVHCVLCLACMCRLEQELEELGRGFCRPGTPEQTGAGGVVCRIGMGGVQPWLSSSGLALWVRGPVGRFKVQGRFGGCLGEALDGWCGSGSGPG